MHFDKELNAIKELYRSGKYDSVFYRARITDESQLESYEGFQSIPFMYKRELRNSTVMERTTTEKKDIFGVFSSSGTTGEKTFYVYSKKDKQVHEEFVKTFYTELEITEDDIGCIMAPVDTGVMAHSMMWQFTTMGAGYINCPEPSPENIIDTVTKVPVTVIATRPSIAACVAYNPLIKERAQRSSVRKLLLGGGFLSDEKRKLLEEAWDADVYNMFGMSEMFGPMAGECKNKNGQHYLDRYLMIEVVDPETKQPVEDGQIGVAIYTTLWDKGFPLLRYWTDDLIMIRRDTCPCGSTLPRLHYKGRLNDCFVMNGHYVFPEDVENILIRNGCIGEYRVEKEHDQYRVKVETMDMTLSPSVIKELEALFHSTVIGETVSPGGLNYDGHGKRFFVEES